MSSQTPSALSRDLTRPQGPTWLLSRLLLLSIALAVAIVSWNVLVDPWLTIVTCVPPVEPLTWLGAHLHSSATVGDCVGLPSGATVPAATASTVGISLLIACPILALNAVSLVSATGTGACVARLARVVRSVVSHALPRLPQALLPLVLEDRSPQCVDVPIVRRGRLSGGLPCHPRRGPPWVLDV